MKKVGAHVSAAGGVETAPGRAFEIKAGAFALFTKNQKQWQAKALARDQIDSFHRNLQKYHFSPEVILPHDGYLINLGNPDPVGLEKSREAFIDEMRRCQQLGLKMLNFHPGSHKQMITERACLDLIVESVNMALNATEKVTAVIENTAGMGGQVGSRFEQLAYIIGSVIDKNRIGVCLDTCHAFAAGYDFKTEKAYQATLSEFEKVIGFQFLKGMHLNDSKGKLGSRLDRHTSLGHGELGLEPFRMLMNDPRLEEMPLILETVDESLWPQEIELLYSFVKE